MEDLTKNKDFLEKIRSRAKYLSETYGIGWCRWYLFGSVARKAKTPTDIDLLVIYQDSTQAQLIRDSLKEISLSFPIDLLLISYEEEDELKFVDRANCILIYPES